VCALFGPPPLPLPHHQSGRTCSALLFTNFVEEKNVKHNKKNMVFLLVWDKDSYTGRFFVLLPWTCVLQPKLVHLYQTSSILSNPLPVVASVSLRLLYLLLYSEHINHIQVLGFLPFPCPSRVWSQLSVWPMSSNICFRCKVRIWGRTWDFWFSEPE
jgi:hypothetical protein